MKPFTNSTPVEFTPIEGTPYVVLTRDKNFTHKALAEKSLMLEKAIQELPEVQALKEGHLCIDIGCPYADTALIFGERGATVIAFEAQWDAYLCAHFNALFHPNILVIYAAMGNGQPVTCNQDEMDGNLGTRTTTPDPEGTPSYKLDDMVEKLALTRLDFLKVDCENSELFVLQGAEKTIKKFKPTILLEVYKSLLSRVGVTEQDIFDKLTEYGYEWRVAIGFQEDDRYDLLATYKSLDLGIFNERR